MVRVAILDERLPLQLKERPSALGDVEIVWAGHDVQELQRNAKSIRPQVLVANLELIPGAVPDAPMQLLRDTEAELFIAVYSFARRADLAALSGPQLRVLRAPVRLEYLRTQMLSVIVRDVLAQKPENFAASSSSPVAPMRFTAQQLARLSEISTTVDCECPNHLSELVTSLQAFERYSVNCENRNEKDVAVHRRLYLATAQARQVMENALEELIKHEQIML